MVFELVYFCGNEQDGRFSDASFGLKKRQVFFAQFVGVHGQNRCQKTVLKLRIRTIRGQD
jgi:hypothetical protein